MSYILNALKKSEKQRQASQVSQAESLEEKVIDQPYNDDEEKKKKISYWLILLVIVNTSFLSYFIWSFTEINNPSGHQTEVASNENYDLNIQNKSRHRSISKSTTKPQKKSISEHIEKKQQPSIIDLIDKQKAVKNIPPAIAKTAPSKKPLNKEKTKTKTKEIIVAKVDPIATIQNPRDNIIKDAVAKTKVEKTEAPKNIPYLHQLDRDFRRSIPDFNINVFVYSEIEEERFIMIDMTKFQVGEQIIKGLKLIDIRRNSLIVKYNNRTFQIKRK